MPSPVVPSPCRRRLPYSIATIYFALSKGLACNILSLCFFVSIILPRHTLLLSTSTMPRESNIKQYRGINSSVSTHSLKTASRHTGVLHAHKQQERMEQMKEQRNAELEGE